MPLPVSVEDADIIPFIFRESIILEFNGQNDPTHLCIPFYYLV